jgi:hypothetical protein
MKTTNKILYNLQGDSTYKESLFDLIEHLREQGIVNLVGLTVELSEYRNFCRSYHGYEMASILENKLKDYGKDYSEKIIEEVLDKFRKIDYLYTFDKHIITEFDCEGFEYSKL